MAQIMEKIISSLIASFLVVVMFIALNGVSKRIKTATILSIVYAWGTSTWTISSQALWQHGFANLATILSLYFLFLLHRTGKSTKALLVGQFISLSFAVRHSNILFFVTLMIYIYILLFRRHFWLFMVFPVLIGLILAFYNLLMFRNPKGSPPHQFSAVKEHTFHLI